MTFFDALDELLLTGGFVLAGGYNRPFHHGCIRVVGNARACLNARADSAKSIGAIWWIPATPL
jgi:hypothetical protein